MAHDRGRMKHSGLIRMGYVQALFTGNGFSVMDVENSCLEPLLAWIKRQGRS